MDPIHMYHAYNSTRILDDIIMTRAPRNNHQARMYDTFLSADLENGKCVFMKKSGSVAPVGDNRRLFVASDVSHFLTSQHHQSKSARHSEGDVHTASAGENGNTSPDTRCIRDLQ